MEVLKLKFRDEEYLYDLFVEELLHHNSLGMLEEFWMESACRFTLVAALRLLNARPKLRTIGNISKWDVEPSEIETFSQILRRAKSMLNPKFKIVP